MDRMEFVAAIAEHAAPSCPGWARARFGGPEVAPERPLAELESVLAAVNLDPRHTLPCLRPWSNPGPA